MHLYMTGLTIQLLTACLTVLPVQELPGNQVLRAAVRQHRLELLPRFHCRRDDVPGCLFK